MPFKYSCFISYRHGQKALVENFVKDLHQALSNEVVPLTDMEVFVDWERLEGGDFFNENLARALCESVCLIVVFTPTYFSDTHLYCAREYKGMEQLEAQRLNLLGVSADKDHGLIIPIALRGVESIPAEIKDYRQYHDFTKFQLGQRRLTINSRYTSKIEAIAQYIYGRHQAFTSLTEDPCSECETFILPTEAEIKDWLIGMKAPQAPFPGR
jgi:hypothetical protein